MNPQPPIWTGPVILTLCLSVFALVVSAVALGWQVVSWRRSGPRLRVATNWGIAGAPPHALWFIGVGTKNSGRLGTEISQFGFQLSRRQGRLQIVATENAFGWPIQLPQPLAPGASASVMYNVPALLEVLRSNGVSGKGARPFIDTGHGRKLGKRRHLGKMLENLNRPAQG